MILWVTYNAPNPKIPNTAAFSFLEIFKRRTCGQGIDRMNASISTEETAYTVFVTTGRQCLPLAPATLVQLSDIGLQLKMYRKV